ncbi:MAG: carboxypeptidase-like regulatory domain-containing protein [Cytophagales bacterium]|nr:carboxypeptidase-like regulatory domain-containing protein [Cytophaga sp.]
MGYSTKSLPVPKGQSSLMLNVFLLPDQVMEEIVLINKENPAYRILREVVKHKNINDKRKLSAYEYESFNRTEVYINNISDELRQRKIFREVAAVLDSMKTIQDDQGNNMIPVLLSESISDFYYRTNPTISKEIIKAVKVKGIGMDDGSLLSQVLGSTFQDYNFYMNYVRVLDKDFISPISDSWHVFYDYELMDSMYVGEHWCYELSFSPKQKLDLALYGTMWITDSTFALKNIDASIHKEANLNFIDKISFQQESIQTNEGAWLPKSTNITIDVEDLGRQVPSLVAKYYSVIQTPVVNKPREEKFFDQRIEVLEDAQTKNTAYWDTVYQDSTRLTDPAVFKMIDTLGNLPAVKSYVEILDIAINGYKKVGKIDIGPYLTCYSFNHTEGNRLQLGFRTNAHFSRKFIFRGYMAYGTKDERIKYGAGINYILSRKPWTEAGVFFKYDIDQVAVPSERLSNNVLFAALTKWGTLRGPYFSKQIGCFFERDLTRNIMPRVIFRHSWFDPLYNFATYDTQGPNNTPVLIESYQTTEVILQLKLSYDELFLQNGNERISLGSKRWPIATIQYTAGLKGVLNGDYNYHKLQLTIDQSVRIGILGRSNYQFIIGKIYKPVPYPLQEVHIGNQTYFYTTAAFNLMNFFEFASDQYASIRYKHDFEGLFSNRVPLIRKLKWRLFFTSNVLFGSMSAANQALIAPVNAAGEKTTSVSYLDPLKPYLEVGYGIDNIFKCARVDFIHRLSYLDKPDISKFGVKVSFRFIL